MKTEGPEPGISQQKIDMIAAKIEGARAIIPAQPALTNTIELRKERPPEMREFEESHVGSKELALPGQVASPSGSDHSRGSSNGSRLSPEQRKQLPAPPPPPPAPLQSPTRISLAGVAGKRASTLSPMQKKVAASELRKRNEDGDTDGFTGRAKAPSFRVPKTEGHAFSPTNTKQRGSMLPDDDDLQDRRRGSSSPAKERPSVRGGQDKRG